MAETTIFDSALVDFCPGPGKGSRVGVVGVDEGVDLPRSIKYEEVHLKAYADGREARAGIGAWMAFYNERRPHN